MNGFAMTMMRLVVGMMEEAVGDDCDGNDGDDGRGDDGNHET